jgi:NadR type nicotinamide-nucleotide adenylyltransferase
MVKIALTGPESSGKTTLAQHLAAHFGAPCVQEFARLYLDSIGRPYHAEDLPIIAHGQLGWEKALAKSNPPLLICDTDLLVLQIWSEFKYGHCQPAILQYLREADYTAHILCRPDIPWAFDPLREHPEQREILFELYLRALQQAGALFIIAEGAEEQRRQAAVRFVGELLEKQVR